MAASTQQPGPDDAYKKMFVRLGFNWDNLNPQQLQTALTPLGTALRNFSESPEYKKSFFGTLPKLGELMRSVEPDVMRFTRHLGAFGAASKQGLDGGQFYNSLGLVGKGLANVTNFLTGSSAAATATGKAFIMLGTAMTFGIGLVVAIVAKGLQLIWDFAKAGAVAQERLTAVSKTLGGISQNELNNFNRRLLDTTKTLGSYGFAMKDMMDTMHSYLSSGMSMLESTNTNLIKTTQIISKLTNTSNTEVANFFSSIMRGSRIGQEGIEKLSAAFATYNQQATATGKLGVTSFQNYRQAIESASTSLLISAARGGDAVRRMSTDLAALSGMAASLNINISEMNRGFEESASLVNNTSSGFRALLAISGGANIDNLLTNQFNRTEAMIRMASTLQNLNSQLGGNLNILGEVAQSSFGIAKETAIKLATMTAEQKSLLLRSTEFTENLQKGGFAQAWERSVATFSEAWERMKNVFSNAIQRAFSSNEAFQTFLNKITTTLGSWVTMLGDPNSPLTRITDKLGSFFTKFANWLSEVWDTLPAKIDSMVNWVNSLFDGTSNKLTKTADSLGESLGFGLMRGIVKFLWKVSLPGLVSSLIGRMFDDSDTRAQLAAQAKAQADAMAAPQKQASMMLLKSIQSDIKKLEDEKQRLAGIKDTDIVINKRGEFTLAGLERLSIDKDLEARKDQVATITENTSAIDKLTTAIYTQIASTGKEDEATKAAKQEIERRALRPPLENPISPVR